MALVAYEASPTETRTLAIVPVSDTIILTEHGDTLVQLALSAVVHLVRTDTGWLQVVV